MRYLGVDCGTKKVGLALSDEEGVMAFPHRVVQNDTHFLKTLRELIAQEKVDAVVIGHSLSFKGEENPIMKEVHRLKETLEADKLVVHLEPEFLTTKQAREHTANAYADASAAALILQTFLDKKNI